MSFQPLSVVITLIGGLVLAGILGWIRRPRLVVFVPRLFSHSKISDKGQIAEISIMNRGFKTEEAIDRSLNPHLHYELIGSNNPDATLSSSRLSIPRIGSADDCSILLQVENGRFSHDDIVSCLSKEAKAKVTTKLEDIPVTAQQRVVLLALVTLFALVVVFGFLGIDKLLDKDPMQPSASTSTTPDLQEWKVPSHYEGGAIYKSFVAKRILITVSAPTLKSGVLSIPIKASNNSDTPLTLMLSATGSASQDNVDFGNRHVLDKLLFPAESSTHTLAVAIEKDDREPRAVLEFFLETTDGDSMKGIRVVSAE